jgi:hypothetical protein
MAEPVEIPPAERAEHRDLDAGIGEIAPVFLRQPVRADGVVHDMHTYALASPLDEHAEDRV